MKKIIILLFFIGFFAGNVRSQLTGDTLTGIRLSSFNASKLNNEVRLNWQVACHVSFARFEVQRSSDGINFSAINSFQSDYLRCRQPFDYTDPSVTGQVFYRIKVGDLDGRFSTEKVVKVSGKEITGTEIKIVSPVAGDFLQLTVAAAVHEPIRLQILDISGHKLRDINIDPGKGVSQLEIPCNNFLSGVYLLHYYSNGKNGTIRFVKNY